MSRIPFAILQLKLHTCHIPSVPPNLHLTQRKLEQVNVRTNLYEIFRFCGEGNLCKYNPDYANRIGYKQRNT
jgi:hypothetical protein